MLINKNVLITYIIYLNLIPYTRNIVIAHIVNNNNFSIFSPGVFLCIAIVFTNLAVMKALCMKSGIYNKHSALLMRRVSRGSSLTCNAATKEERLFGRLMLILCIFFVTFWIPQMVMLYVNLT